MTCDALDFEGRGRRPLSAEEQQHLSACATCQQAHALWAALPATGGAGPSAELSARIRLQALQALSQEPRARRWTGLFGVACGAAIVPGVVSLLLVSRRPDWTALSALGIGGNLALLALAFVLAGRAAFAPGLFPRGRALAAAAAVLGALALLVFPGPHHGAAGGGGAGCFLAVLGFSALPLLLLFGGLRAHTRSGLAGLCMGLAAGALGEAALFVHCPACGLGHLCRAHLAAWGLVALLGAALVLAFPRRIYAPTGRGT